VNPFFIMALQLDLDYTSTLAPQEFDRFASLIDPTWIDEALRQTNTVSLRRRRLPAERMVWLVIGLALFRNEPIWHIVDTYSHLVRGASFGDFRTGELSFAKPLMQEVPDNSLTMFDRAYFSAAFLLDWQQAGEQRHWLMRAKTPLRHE
jgi:hypothetical protein